MEGDRNEDDIAQIERRRGVRGEQACEPTAGDPLAGVLVSVQQAGRRARLGSRPIPIEAESVNRHQACANGYAVCVKRSVDSGILATSRTKHLVARRPGTGQAPRATCHAQQARRPLSESIRDTSLHAREAHDLDGGSMTFSS